MAHDRRRCAAGSTSCAPSLLFAEDRVSSVEFGEQGQKLGVGLFPGPGAEERGHAGRRVLRHGLEEKDALRRRQPRGETASAWALGVSWLEHLEQVAREGLAGDAHLVRVHHRLGGARRHRGAFATPITKQVGEELQRARTGRRAPFISED